MNMLAKSTHIVIKNASINSEYKVTLICIFYCHLAPTSAPLLQVVSVMPLSITVNWTEIPCSERNGKIGYNLTLCLSVFPRAGCVHYITNNTTLIITELTPRTRYTISIRGFTLVNNRTLNGIASQIETQTAVIDS